MEKLQRLSGKEVIKALSKMGFEPIRQRGSHVFMRKESPEGKRTTVVPFHREIDKGTLLEILHQAGLEREEFFRLL